MGCKLALKDNWIYQPYLFVCHSSSPILLWFVNLRITYLKDRVPASQKLILKLINQEGARFQYVDPLGRISQI